MMEQFEQRKQDKEDLFKKLDSLSSNFKQLNETLDSTSEGIKETLNKNREPVNQKIKEKEEEIENKEDSSVLFSVNKNNNNKEKIKHIKTNCRRVKKLSLIHI